LFFLDIINNIHWFSTVKFSTFIGRGS
jgi:hypothetical protein